MLLYLINVVDNTWVLAVAAPMILYFLKSDKARKGIRRLVWAAAALGLVASAVLAALRLNTGWVIREFYDLGVLVPLLGALLVFIVLSTIAKTGSGLKSPSPDGSSAPVVKTKLDQIIPISLEQELRNVSASLIRILIASVLSVCLAALFYRLFKARPVVSVPVSLAVLLPMFFFFPAKIRNLRIPLIVSGLAGIALLTARVAPNLMLYPFEFGVGMDSFFNLDYLGKVSGYLFGLMIMALVWLSIRFLSKQTPPKIFKCFLFLGLLVILAQLSLETFQILAARRMLPRPLFSLVLYFLERKYLFLFAQIAVWTVLAIYLIVYSRLTKPVGQNPALERKMKAALRDDLRAGILLLASMTLVIVTSTTLRAINSRGPVISEPDPIAAVAGMIRLDLATISDGNLHRHVYQTEEGTPVRFIVIKKSQSAFGVGLDACDICGQSGYYQRGDQVICKLCDVVMNKSTIGFPGGCNPVPLKFTLGEGNLLIDPAELEAEVHRFK